jgi:predicted transport protein
MRPETMGQAILRNLPARTGKTVEEWIEIVRRKGPPDRRGRVEWLKSVHGLGHVTAEQIVGAMEPPAAARSDEELIAAQYAGEKVALRPIYDTIAAIVAGLGADVTLEARQTYVSLQRGRQFGLVQPSTRTRIDIGLRLPGAAATPRLQPAGNFGSGTISHRIAVEAAADVDAELIGWIRSAYEARA